MAEKKTTAKKKTTKKAKDNKIIKEVAESIIKKEEFEEATKEAVDQDPPLTNLDAEIEGVDEANLNAMRNEWEVKSEPEYTPTVEQVEKAIETMNGDPSVIIPSNEIEIKKDLTTEIEKKAFRDTFRELNNNKKLKLDNSFGYSWNGMEMD
jgi:hypothetical protein